jgi:hypothetical protein
MIRLFVLAALLTTATVAVADPDWSRTAGTRGTVTAYELDGRTIISHKTCLSMRSTWDYSRCNDRLRDTVKFEVCRSRGSGTHHYLHQIGDGRPYRASVYCTRR